MQQPARRLPEIWGGVECSHVLIHGRIRDQILETGHRNRDGDLDQIASLGIRTLRYPVHWANVVGADHADFAWEDRRLSRLQELGVDPIAGFLHHGSGPGGLHPLQDAFVTGLADYAEAVARRYPWLRRFTPINEPVTTARFSFLYGHWHPHMQDEGAFLRAVVRSVIATVAVMKRIRVHIPEAELIQTEDFGRTFSPRPLSYQSDYENERRFIGIDLLTGRVDKHHYFYDRLLAAAVEPSELDALVEQPCAPEIIGLDYYLTSDRYLDSQMHGYSNCSHGGNAREPYADVAAAHIESLHGEIGFLPRLRELHSRYGLPIALTEVHNGAHLDSQLRWLMAAWESAASARTEGIVVPAVTAWSLYGAVDWNSLLCERHGHYEAGAFDAFQHPPKLTYLGQALAGLLSSGSFDSPALRHPDWWQTSHPRFLARGGTRTPVTGKTDAP